MWTRQEFETAGQKIGTEFTALNGEISIDTLATKVAQDGGLNEEGIRTLVRIANVTAFENLFSKKASDGAPDRMIDFKLGDAEAVVRNIREQSSQYPALQKVAAYNRAEDLYADLPIEHVEMTKEAGVSSEETAPEKAYAAPVLKQRYNAAYDRVQQEYLQLAERWDATMEKAANIVKYSLGSHKYNEFEKHAAAYFGDNSFGVELYALPQFSNVKSDLFEREDMALTAIEKIASETVVNTMTDAENSILLLVKEAHTTRMQMDNLSNGLSWLTTEIANLGV
jgi:hypothetical protein